MHRPLYQTGWLAVYAGGGGVAGQKVRPTKKESEKPKREERGRRQEETDRKEETMEKTGAVGLLCGQSSKGTLSPMGRG
jgi:hypothetical protein